MLTLANHTFPSRLLTGTGKFSNPDTMKSAVQAAKSSMVTLAMKRVASHSSQDETLSALKALGVTLLPNTSGAKTNATCCPTPSKPCLPQRHWLKKGFTFCPTAEQTPFYVNA